MYNPQVTAISDLPRPRAPERIRVLKFVDRLSGKISCNLFSQYGKSLHVPSGKCQALPKYLSSLTNVIISTGTSEYSEYINLLYKSVLPLDNSVRTFNAYSCSAFVKLFNSV